MVCVCGSVFEIIKVEYVNIVMYVFVLVLSCPSTGIFTILNLGHCPDVYGVILSGNVFTLSGFFNIKIKIFLHIKYINICSFLI